MRTQGWAVLGLSFVLSAGVSVQAEDGESKGKVANTIAKNYYVGDFLSKPDSDFSPMVELITSTIARDTWKVAGSEGGPAIGSITPFPLSLSLVIRHSPETHDEISNLLRKIRDLPVIKNSGEQ